jgi:integrase
MAYLFYERALTRGRLCPPVFFAALRKPKYRALFMTCYAAGLRLGETCHLRVDDINSQRMVIHVRGKGGQERLTILSPRLLDVLRAYWRLAKPKGWLFPGATSARPVALDTARSVFHSARAQAGLPRGYTSSASSLTPMPPRF